jgi:two-component system LytT family response regulator
MASHASQNPTRENVLLLPTNRGLEIIDINTIIRIEAISNYSKLFFADGRSLVVAKLLSWFENKLATSHFIRLHRRHVVNLSYIRGTDNLGGTQVVLVNDEKLLVSRRRRIEFMHAVYRYYGVFSKKKGNGSSAPRLRSGPGTTTCAADHSTSRLRSKSF